MSIADSQPSSQNYIYPNNFNFRIKRLPNLNFTLQGANLPGISVGRIDQPNLIQNAPLQGDRLFFADLNITFLVDEDLKNYRELFTWMSKISNQSFKSGSYLYKNLKDAQPGTDEGLFSDLTMTILTSAKNPNIRITFTDAFPIQLSDLIFDSQADPSQFSKAQVVFTYRDYDFEIIGS
jgi:hypothetical protein